MQDRHPGVQTSLLAAAELPRRPVQCFGQAHQGGDVLHPSPRRPAGQSGQPGEAGEILPHCESRVDTQRLRGDAEVACRGTMMAEGIHTRHLHAAGIGPLQACQDRDERRLARAVHSQGRPPDRR